MAGSNYCDHWPFYEVLLLQTGKYNKILYTCLINSAMYPRSWCRGLLPSLHPQYNDPMSQPVKGVSHYLRLSPFTSKGVPSAAMQLCPAVLGAPIKNNLKSHACTATSPFPTAGTDQAGRAEVI